MQCVQVPLSLVAELMCLIDELLVLLQETVQKWEALSQDQKLDVATELIPDIEQV